ncbi:class I SAM-dependent DNA methyltransferase [Corallococcus terminator]|uniref:site-specific DNA-methyltransferase (adenine-specific) n=1 Tax=Corallococcus terminator TaxID=2316733 RepID=A0A3A8HT36_9BACT|nr:class I SAM-dependent DNA methyltransferase [Corallococcus terminator]
MELTKAELTSLHEAAIHDWTRVNPAIFGTIFQSTMDEDERHAYGAHFTHEQDILKVVNPTIIRPWQDRIDKAGTLKELLEVKKALNKFRVIDPACGSGNFLYVAFRALKRLEIDLLLAIRKAYSGKKAQAVAQGSLSVQQFYGFDVIPFAVELAKVTLLLAKELALKEAQEMLGDDQGMFDLDPALPLENLNSNIVCADALLSKWPKVDVIIGNPPFVSKNNAAAEIDSERLAAVRKAMPEVSRRADYCVYFFRRAHEELPLGGRAGLVGTNTIRENESRDSGLSYIVNSGGTIVEAVSTQHWSGDAAVHVSIVNWVRGTATGKKALFSQAEDGTWSRADLTKIGPALRDGVDVSSAQPLKRNADSAVCFQGQTHGHEGFLPFGEDLEMILKDRSSRDVVHPYLIGEDLVGRKDSSPSRYILNLNHCGDLFEAMKHKSAFAHLAKQVQPDIEEAARKEHAKSGKASGPRQSHAKRWWKHWRGREEMLAAIGKLSRYIACSRVTKRPIFEFVSSEIHPSDVVQVFALEDDYSFGVLQSGLHWKWFITRCSTLEERPRYTSDTVFDSFPWPQDASEKQALAVAKAAHELRQLRRSLMMSHGWSLRDLYRASEQGGKNDLGDAQAALDECVGAAFGMSRKEQEEPLAFFLELNLSLAGAEGKNRIIVGPGLAPCVKKREKLVTSDCIVPAGLP